MDIISSQRGFFSWEVFILYIWLLISSLYFKNIFRYTVAIYVSWILFFTQKSLFSHQVNVFFQFWFYSISAFLGICICRNLAEALLDFLQLFSKTMFVNGYLYQKSIFPVFKVLHMAGWSSFLNKEYFWLHKFYFIYLINVIVVILETHARHHYLCKSS
jgi:hypothetical protein